MNDVETSRYIVKVLGSGTCIPLASRYPSSYFIKLPRSTSNWLIDLGSGALQRLSQAGESYQNLDNIFISHVHPDHIMSIVPLLQALNNTPNYHRAKPLVMYGPPTVQEYLQANLNFAPGWRPSFPFEFVALEDKNYFSCQECDITVRMLQHSTFTLGYRFEIEGRSLVYGADTEPCDAIIELASRANLLIIEASYRRDHPTKGHMTTFQAGEVARKAEVQKLLLSHFLPEVDNMEEQDRKAEVRASGYTGEIFFASDLMELSVL